jgi:hypothetical protein
VIRTQGFVRRSLPLNVSINVWKSLGLLTLTEGAAFVSISPACGGD